MVRVIRFNAFSSKAVKRILHGRSSDLFLLRAPSRNTLPVALSRLLATYLWNLQQRDCSGFAPDSLFNHIFRRKTMNQCVAKIERIFRMAKEWYGLIIVPIHHLSIHNLFGYNILCRTVWSIFYFIRYWVIACTVASFNSTFLFASSR